MADSTKADYRNTHLSRGNRKAVAEVIRVAFEVLLFGGWALGREVLRRT